MSETSDVAAIMAAITGMSQVRFVTINVIIQLGH